MSQLLIRIVLSAVLLVLACLLCGVYGILHNQLSYSISPEYFTAFKFRQFAISPVMHGRLGAAIVGWEASWWMGMVIGFFLIPFGHLVRTTSGFLRAVLRAYLVVLATAITVGVFAIGLGWLTITPDDSKPLLIGDRPIQDVAGFLRAGMLHNFSYLGGLLGIVTGVTSIMRRFLRGEKADAPNEATDDQTCEANH
ncbi:MAG: hypothetical protein AAFV88_22510 [Planctomycetota bacterium]